GGVGPPGVRIHEDDQAPSRVGEVDGAARRGTQGNVREAGYGEMIASPVVEWNRELRREGRRRHVGHQVVARFASRKGHRDPTESAVGLTLNKVNRRDAVILQLWPPNPYARHPFPATQWPSRSSSSRVMASGPRWSGSATRS